MNEALQKSSISTCELQLNSVIVCSVEEIAGWRFILFQTLKKTSNAMCSFDIVLWLPRNKHSRIKTCCMTRRDLSRPAKSCICLQYLKVLPAYFPAILSSLCSRCREQRDFSSLLAIAILLRISAEEESSWLKDELDCWSKLFASLHARVWRTERDVTLCYLSL